MTEEDKLHQFSVLVRQSGSPLKTDIISCQGWFAQRRWEIPQQAPGKGDSGVAAIPGLLADQWQWWFHLAQLRGILCLFLTRERGSICVEMHAVSLGRQLSMQRGKKGLGVCHLAPLHTREVHRGDPE